MAQRKIVVTMTRGYQSLALSNRYDSFKGNMWDINYEYYYNQYYYF